MRVRVSRPAELASGLRRYWGQHVLWEALPARGAGGGVELDKYLPAVLKDKFTLARERGGAARLSLVDRIKRLLFSRAMVSLIRRGLARDFDEMGAFHPGQIRTMLPTAEPGRQQPVVFNLVICGPKVQERVTITRVEVNKAAPDWVLSKHVLMAGYDPDVRFAGEVWAERYTGADGSEQVRLHINNNSGTYHPDAAQLQAAAAYLAALLPGIELVPHALPQPPSSPPPPVSTTDDRQRTYDVQPGQYEQLRERLEGKIVALRQGRGTPREFVIRRFKRLELETLYFDTPGRLLLRAGAMLRSRTRFGKAGSGRRVKEIELEAKAHAAGPAGPVSRVRGAVARSQAEWDARQAAIFAGHEDSAVRLARSVAAPESRFEPVAAKHTHRELYLVIPKMAFGLGWLRPGFAVSLDSSVVRHLPEGRGLPPGEDASPWHTLEPQIFTRLPWTATITPRRLEQFEDLCSQLSTACQLAEASLSGYALAMSRVVPRPSEPGG